MANDFYVYAYYEPGHAHPFYIGKGHDDRCVEHLEPNVLNRYQDPFHKKLRAMLADGYKPDIQKLEEDLTEIEATNCERKLIRLFGFRSNGGSLLNMTDGGDGVSGYRHTESSRIKIREKRATQDMSYTYKPIVAKLAGIIIFRYARIIDVEIDGFHRANVISVLKGRRRTSGGFEWEYA